MVPIEEGKRRIFMVALSKPGGEIHIPVVGGLPSFKFRVVVGNKAVALSRPLMCRGTSHGYLSLHNNSLERDAAKSGGAPQLCRYVQLKS